MNFGKAIKTITKLLKKEKPKTFSSSWISTRSPLVYHFIRVNFRTENNHIDWDKVTAALDPKYAKCWMRYKRKVAKPYENQIEVDIILTKYKDKLYTFVALVDDGDKETRNQLIIALVRIAQKGNILAQLELTKWLKYVVDDWVDKYYPLFKWKGYTDDIEDKIHGCIRCYKYTGSFLGYLFKTLEYSGRGIRPLQAWSLDKNVGDDGATMIDFVAQDSETGEVKLFGR